VTRAAVAFPGPGSYGPRSLGSLPAEHQWVRAADVLRADAGLRPLTEVDGADRFDPAVHLRPSNGWPLIFLAGLLDAERIADDHEVVVAVASSTGWYTALAAAGVLDFADAFRVVQQLGLAAEEPLDAGPTAELVYPLTDPAWEPVADRLSAVDAAIDEAADGVSRALALGSHVVIGGLSSSLRTVAAALPAVTIGPRAFPFEAAGYGWHTPLRADSAARARERIGEVPWQRPNVPLVDERGVRHTPWSADTAALAEGALVRQPSATYDFASAFRVALREYAPDVILLPGPGASLGGPCAQLIVAEGYRGLRSRQELEQAQGGGSPILLSMRR
jgi:hypothetical protein